MEYDLIIVGSGSVGSAAGYFAAKDGCKVLMIDCYTPPHKCGSHHGSTRINRRAYFEGSKYVPLSLRTQQLWEQLAQKTGKDIMRPCGVLNMGPRDSQFIMTAHASSLKYNLNTELLTAEEVTQRWPGFTGPKDYVAVYEPNIGMLRCEIIVEMFIKLSKEAGAEHLFNTTVTAVTPIGNGVEVTTRGGKYRSRKVLISAGSWTKNIIPDLPVNILRKVFMWHDVDEMYKNIPSFIIEMDGDIYYGLPAEENGLKVGKHTGSGKILRCLEDYVPYGSEAGDSAETAKFLKIFMPHVGRIMRGETCMYDMSPDDDFIIDTMQGCDNVLIMAGFSGHGFKFIPVLGEMAAMFARGDQYPIDMSQFSLKRFKRKASL